MLFTIVIIFVVFLPLCLFFSHYNTPKTKNKSTIQKTKQQQLSTMERMPKHFTDSAGSDSKLMTHLYDDATTILESLERGCSLNGQSFWLMLVNFLPISGLLLFPSSIRQLSGSHRAVHEERLLVELQDCNRACCPLWRWPLPSAWWCWSACRKKWTTMHRDLFG